MKRISLLALLVVSVLACPGQPPPQTPVAGATKKDEGPLVWRASKSGLGFRLSNADEERELPKGAAPSEPLSDSETQALLGRLPALKGDTDDAKDFAFRGKSLPPPRPGKTTAEAFPPPSTLLSPPVVAAGPLTITRKMPVGAVDIAPYLTVSFSAPMVPVTSHAELERSKPPVRLTPEPPGKWRWVGAQTVMFQPENEFPKSTDYAVEIPAGTRGIQGNVLAAAETFTFTTPTVRLVQHYPSGSAQPLEPVLFAAFDQTIDKNAVLSMTRATAGSESLALRLATDEEIDKDPHVSRLVEKAKKGRFIAFRADRPLPTGSSIQIVYPPGLPSAEGPKRTTTQQAFSFRTYDPLRIVRATCGHLAENKACHPNDGFDFAFNNPLDAEKFDASMVKVDPPIAGMKVQTSYNSMTISGKTKGRTRYTVRVTPPVTDQFGQTLGREETRTFDVGTSPPILFSESSHMSIVDPALGPKYSVYSINDPTLNVRLYSVAPTDWVKYNEFRSKWDYDGVVVPPPGRLVHSGQVATKGEKDSISETLVDLTPALKNGFGQVLVIVETTRPFKNRWQKQWVRTWLQVTKLGITAVADNDSIVSWSTSLLTGKPESGVEFTALGGVSGRSNAEGIAVLSGGASAQEIYTARKGDDLAIWFGNLKPHFYHPSPVRFFTWDDRGIYKPGEEAKIRGWVRNVSYEKNGDVGFATEANNNVLSYRVYDARGSEMSKGTTAIDDRGNFDFAVKFPDNTNLGHARVELSAPSGNGSHTLNIQEFRRPEFEVSAQATGAPYFVGRHGIATVTAKYYAGGGLPNAATQWTVSRSEAYFAPPNQPGYSFGNAEHDSWYGYGRSAKGKKAPTSETWDSHTDSQGEHRLRVDFDALEPSYPMSLSLSAVVTDVNRQAWSANTNMLVHPASVYAGLHAEKSFVTAGQPLQIDVIAANVEGARVAGRDVSLRSVRLDSVQERGVWTEKEVDEDTCVVKSAAGAVRCSLKTKAGGRYRVTAFVTDEHGRKSQTTMGFWVVGKDESTPDRSLSAGHIELVSDKTEYKSGDTAEVLVRSGFAPAEGLLTVRRSGVVSVQRFTLESKSQTLTVPLRKEWVPGVTVSVELVGTEARNNENGVPDPALPRKPTFGSGSVALSIPPAERTLQVFVTPKEKALDPGGSTTVAVDVKDSAGNTAANADVALFVVDEAVLALTAYKTPDPLTTFYPMRSPDASQVESRSLVVLGKESEALRAKHVVALDEIAIRGDEESGGERGDRNARMAPGRAMAGGLAGLGAKAEMAASAAPMAPEPMQREAKKASGTAKNKAPDMPETPIVLRKDLTALALWAPRTRTDARGHAEVSVKLPESTTRYRVMAIAAADATKFGSGEANITARLPLIVRASPPRFLNFGDKFELSVVVQNQTDKPMTVSVAARALNAAVDARGRRVQVAPGDRAEVRIPSSAKSPGKARFQVAAGSGHHADAAEFDLPVWTPATTEAFATYGVVDQGAVAQPVKMPEGVTKEFGGLELTTSSTALFALSDAVLYLVKYPFECNEQLSSRVMAVASMKDVLAAFNAKELPAPEVLRASVEEDLKRLQTRQSYNGGWGFWWGDDWPYLSIHVAHSIQRAKEKGFAVNVNMLTRAQGYLRSIESHIPSYYGPEARRSLIAYALYVRKRMNDADPAKARRLVADAGGVEKTPLESLGWLLPTFSGDPGSKAELEAVRKHLANRVTETAGAAHFVTSYGEGDYLLLNSDRRADGILLESIIADDPKNDVIPKLVTGLLGHRKAGRWTNTQENAFVLIGLDKYFRTYENTAPDFIARAWLGDQYAGEHAYRGYNVDRQEVRIPMKQLASLGSGNLTIQKDGPGRLYFRVGMQYAPLDLKLPPADHGFTVTRIYEPVDSPDDVKRDAEGNWHVKAGAKVRTRVTMVAPARRHHVALVDPIPAGFEPMNAALAVTGPIPRDTKANENHPSWFWWSRTWYEHQNMRDERVEAFASLLWDGVHEYVYVARATTLGTFVVAPPKAEEMYSPEVFGRGAGDRVTVE
ncbi:MAG: alpha-2-macroglobulin family protein [Polyangiaceae bacterium]